jgi:hypothetical protein
MTGKGSGQSTRNGIHQLRADGEKDTVKATPSERGILNSSTRYGAGRVLP